MHGFVFMLLTVAQATELINETNMEYYLLLNSINETDQNYTYFNGSEYNITYPACVYGECPANTTEYSITIPVPCPMYYKTNTEGAGDIHECVWDPKFNVTHRRSDKTEATEIGFIATVGAVAGTSAVVAGVVVGLQAAGVIPSTVLSTFTGFFVAQKMEPPKYQRPNPFRNIKIEPVHFSKPHGPGLSRTR
jgi:hypothetical protein